MSILANPLADEFDGTEGEARAMSMNPVGPIADRFAKDQTYLSCIMGPYGSAKTTTCFQRILWAAMWQRRGPDGIRRSRGCIIRDTYAQLQANVMEDWFAWFPKTKDNWNGETLTHTIRYMVPNIDGPGEDGIIEIQVLFRAMGDLKAEAIFKGMQLTWLWLNEADTLSLQVLKFGAPRVGRYPRAKDGGCAWSGIFADMNAPDNDNWTYETFVDGDMGMTAEEMDRMRELYGSNFGVAFHRQPGGLEPEAENLENLPDGYYDRLKITLTNDNDRRRFIDNEFGAVRNGQPVYPEYIDSFHTSDRVLKPVPGLPIYMAVDGGWTPAAVFGQKLPDGSIRVLAELVIFESGADDNQLAKLGAKSFARDCAAFVAERFPNAKIKEGWGDPAAGYGGDEEDLSWRDDFSREFKLRIKDAPVRGNRIGPRIEGVRSLLTINIGGKPALTISKDCRYLRRGFNNGYVIERVKRSNGVGQYRDLPSKNDFSHVHDALQYLIAGLTKAAAVNDDLDQRDRARRVRQGVTHTGTASAGRQTAPQRAQRRR